MPALLLLIQPPAIPPISIASTAAALLFLFTLFLSNIFGSLAKSQYTLVKTVVGTSLKPNNRLVTICPPLWKAKNPNGNNSRKLTSKVFSVTRPCGSGTTWDCTREAAMMMQMDWSRKEVASVPRALGEMRRVFANVKQPRRKQAIETRDLSQPSGWEAGWPDAPRARKIVLPVDVNVREEWGRKVGGEDGECTSLHGHEA
jgi:hypothetical protein